MASTQTQSCWASCLLTSMLIRHLEDRDAEAAKRLDYRQILSVAGLVQDVPDPHAFLSDPNNWVPHDVLRELIRTCEEAGGTKRFTYEAARANYRNATLRSATLLESIAIFLGDVRTLLQAVTDWAEGYTNYVRFQAFGRAGAPREVGMLSWYRSPVEPLSGNIGLVRGNVEGLASLDPGVKDVSMQEEISQVRLENLIAEFGDRYVLRREGRRMLVVDQTRGEVVVTARPVALQAERIPPVEPFPHALSGREDHLIVRPDAGGGLTVLTPSGKPLSAKPSSGTGLKGEPAVIIERGGTLCNGRLHLSLEAGAVYGAPYSRYRITWGQEAGAREGGEGPPASLVRNKKVYAQLVLRHLKNLQMTQRRTLSMMIRNVELAEENVQLRQELSARQDPGGIVGKSKAMQDVLALIRTVADSDTTVLITGETGSGKELAARLIHQLSKRRDRRFVAVNCGAIPESLLESELFGHERGSFTGAVSRAKGKFELAEGGSLFLDEIGDLPQAVQVKLLRVLQEKEFQRVGGTADLKADVRVVAATNRDLDAMLEQHQFRSDLYYRLNVIQVYLPPLRERVEDLPALAQHAVDRLAARTGRPIQGLAPEALNLCLAYRWPGNVRELENILERAFTLAPEGCRLITPDLLPPALRHPTPAAPASDLPELVNRMEWSALLHSLRNSGSLSALLGRLEWAITTRAVVEYGGNKSRAARALGRTYRWLRKLESQMMKGEADQTDRSDPSDC